MYPIRDVDESGAGIGVIHRSNNAFTSIPGTACHFHPCTGMKMTVGILSGVYLHCFHYALGVDDVRGLLDEDETGTISIAAYGYAWVVNAMSTCCVLIALFFVVFCKLKKNFFIPPGG